jgi:uncharacterized protein YyaL (SSP411 family)
MLSLMAGEAHPGPEVALVGGLKTPEGRALRSAVLSRYLPDRTVAGREDGTELPERIPLLDGRGTIDGRPTAYVCRDFVCERPVTDVEALARSLDAASTGVRRA